MSWNYLSIVLFLNCVLKSMNRVWTFLRPWKIDCWYPLTWENFLSPAGRLFNFFSLILPGQLISLSFLVEKNIFEASHVTFFNTNYKFVPLLFMDTRIKMIVCDWNTTKSIMNRPVFVLEFLRKFWTFLNFWTVS
jgi:hypothetical protein